MPDSSRRAVHLPLPGHRRTSIRHLRTFSLKAHFEGLRKLTRNVLHSPQWWHAHRRALYIDGITGPLIVHSRNDPLVRGRDFDIDQVCPPRSRFRLLFHDTRVDSASSGSHRSSCSTTTTMNSRK